MFLDGNSQYCGNDYAMQSNLEIQYNLIKLPMEFFHRIRTKKFSGFLKHKRSQTAKSILRKRTRDGGP